MQDPADCSVALPPPTDVTLEASPSYGVTASEVNPLGYAVDFCYRCEIKPTDLPVIAFDHLFTVTGLQLDCSSSLTPTGLGNPTPIGYNSGGTTTSMNVFADYTSVFAHTQLTD